MESSSSSREALVTFLICCTVSNNSCALTGMDTTSKSDGVSGRWDSSVGIETRVDGYNIEYCFLLRAIESNGARKGRVVYDDVTSYPLDDSEPEMHDSSFMMSFSNAAVKDKTSHSASVEGRPLASFLGPSFAVQNDVSPYRHGKGSAEHCGG